MLNHPVELMYTKADDSQKVWVESVNRYFRSGGFKLLKKYFDNYIRDTEDLAKSILGKLPKRPKMVVDIGAGYGGIAINIAHLGIRVIAVEPESDERKIIRYFSRKDKRIKSNLKVVNASAEKLPLKSGSADLCIVSQVLEHVEDIERAIGEMARVLKKGRYSYISCPNYLFPIEQHYNLPYFPLMSHNIFSSWALFLLKTLNLRSVKNAQNRDFSRVSSFIFTVNYTTDDMIKRLAKKYKLRLIWSSPDETGSMFQQIRRHFIQSTGPKQVFLILLSLPIKLIRVMLTKLGILPMKLEYLFQRT